MVFLQSRWKGPLYGTNKVQSCKIVLKTKIFMIFMQIEKVINTRLIKCKTAKLSKGAVHIGRHQSGGPYLVKVIKFVKIINLSIFLNFAICLTGN